jgi:NAD(P)-dependent dehydrogenase (short-subunit alcohol dehydrogenase family)
MTIPQNPRAVVTGAAGGLGRAFCLALAKRGAKIIVSDRDLAGAEETARLVTEAGGVGHAVSCDVTKREDVEKLAVIADDRFGGTDLLINNAGVAVSGPIGEIPLKDWEWIVNINMWGVIYGCHVFAPRFKAQGSGHVLNVASAAGLLSAPEMGPYNVTKAAVVALSETLSGELRPLGIGVTVLCPTFFQTNILTSSRSETIKPSLQDVAAERMKQSKIQANDVAEIALRGCDRGDLFVVPMSDGKWAWRMKRLAPESYFAYMPRVMKYMEKKQAAKH